MDPSSATIQYARVDHRGLDVLVPQQLPDRRDVVTILQQNLLALTTRGITRRRAVCGGRVHARVRRRLLAIPIMGRSRRSREQRACAISLFQTHQLQPDACQDIAVALRGSQQALQHFLKEQISAPDLSFRP